MSWDFSIYPEMTEAQKRAVFSIGITLQGLQGVEQVFGFCLRFVFPSDPTLGIRELYTMDAAHQKRTLGQLVTELRKRVEVHADFDAWLVEFIALRNRFVHRLFTEREFTLATDDSCARSEEIMSRLQTLMWDIQTIIMGYNMLWAQHSGIPQVAAASEAQIQSSEHLQQVQSHFQHVLKPKPRKA